MLMQVPVAAVTGASGYLGSQICDTLETRGWQVWLTGSPGMSHGQVLPYDLATPVTAQVREALGSANALIHAAYDLSLTSPADIWRVNVEGTRRLLEAAKKLPWAGSSCSPACPPLRVHLSFTAGQSSISRP